MLLREKFKLTFIVLPLLLIGMLSACQEPIIEINEPPAEEAFTKTSSVAAFMLRTSLQDGSEDNIIDRASCIKVETAGLTSTTTG